MDRVGPVRRSSREYAGRLGRAITARMNLEGVTHALVEPISTMMLSQAVNRSRAGAIDELTSNQRTPLHWPTPGLL